MCIDNCPEFFLFSIVFMKLIRGVHIFNFLDVESFLMSDNIFYYY